ncbi:MAG: 4Fe-4S binding protein [Anaerolineae bacterium]
MNDTGEDRFDLLQIPVIRQMLRWRAFQWVLTTFTLFFFALAILTGFFGTPAGSKNFSIIFVWIVWWALVIILLVPLAGRFWCTVCPIPMPGEWAQRRAFIGRRPGKLFGLGRRWPRRLRNIWLQNASFLGVALLSGVLLTRPLATGIALLLFVVVAFALSLVFERRAFCRYLCPVGGFIGLYSMAAPLELRVRDREVCRSHTEKTCYLGNSEGYGCPWLVFPGALERNTYCGLCTECLKTCELDNIVLNIRPPGADLLVANGRRLDEAYKGFIMLASALIYSAVFLGPWGWLKDMADPSTGSGQGIVSLGQYLVYTGGFLAINLLILPALFLACTWLAQRLGGLKTTPRKAFIQYAYTLVPLGLLAWIAFSLAFVFVNGSYAVAVVSDPFGWGWNLLGTQGFPWKPFLPQVAPYLQVGLLTAGLVTAVYLAYRIGRQNGADHAGALRAAVPVTAFLTAITLVFLRLYLG